MVNATDALRRWLGMFCLAMAAGMLIVGQTALKTNLDGSTFLVYWIACFGFTFAAIVFALLDVRAVRRQARLEQQELLQRTIHETDPKSVKKPAKSDFDES